MQRNCYNYFVIVPDGQFLMYVAGSLNNKPPNQADTIFTTFESVWEMVHEYVINSLNPKMEVIMSYEYDILFG